MRTFASIVCVCALALCGSSASADIMTPHAFRVEAQLEDGTTGHWELSADDLGGFSQENAFTWSLDQDVKIMSDDGTLSLGVLRAGTTLGIVDAQIVSLQFQVVAGMDPTMISISTGLMMFDEIANAMGRASAGMTATDYNGDGVSVTGGFDGGKSYRADYNGLVPGGTNFATLVNDMSTGDAYETLSQNDDSPMSGFSPIGDPVSSMSSAFKFTLSAGDGASGTSVFVIVPEPATVLFIALGGAVVMARRRFAA